MAISAARVGVPGAEPPVRVVIADDALGIRVLLRAMLDRAGIFSVVGEAGTGVEAIELAERHRPDLVLLDLAMPEMDGLQALPRIRAAVPSGRIVVISGFERRAMEAEVLRHGADGYLPKGTSVWAMLAALHEVLGDRAAGMTIPEPPARPSAERLAPVLAEIEAAREDGGSDAGPADADRARFEATLTVLAHDLRAPLAVASRYADLLETASGDQRVLFVERLRVALDHAETMLESLLTWAWAGAAAADGDVDLGGVVASAIAATADPRVPVRMAVKVGPLPVVRGDGEQLLQVFVNLISNALKYAHPARPPRVHVSAERLEGEWIVTVADNGSGVRADDGERIFSLFARGDTARDRDGHGVGLAICRRVVTAHGGRIWVEPNHPHGSRFRFTLAVS